MRVGDDFDCFCFEGDTDLVKHKKNTTITVN